MFYMYSRLRFCLRCGMAWTDCVQFCLATGQVFSGEILACTEQEMWITLNGAVKQVICWAEFMWRDWEWSCFLTSHPNSWFHFVRLDRRDQSWPRIVVALGDGLNEEMPVTVFPYMCFARWDGDVGHRSHCLHSVLFQGAAFPVAVRELGY